MEWYPRARVFCRDLQLLLLAITGIPSVLLLHPSCSLSLPAQIPPSTKRHISPWMFRNQNLSPFAHPPVATIPSAALPTTSARDLSDEAVKSAHLPVILPSPNSVACATSNARTVLQERTDNLLLEEPREVLKDSSAQSTQKPCPPSRASHNRIRNEDQAACGPSPSMTRVQLPTAFPEPIAQGVPALLARCAACKGDMCLFQVVSAEHGARE